MYIMNYVLINGTERKTNVLTVDKYLALAK